MERAGSVARGAGAARRKNFAAAFERRSGGGADAGSSGGTNHGEPEEIPDQPTGHGDRDDNQQPARLHFRRSRATRRISDASGDDRDASADQRRRFYAFCQDEEYLCVARRQREESEISIQL